MTLTATNCSVHIKIHFTTITTSIYLNTMHEQLTFISGALHCVVQLRQSVLILLSAVRHTVVAHTFQLKV